jgi:hypothetical protein
MLSFLSRYLCFIAFLLISNLLPLTTSAQESLREWTDQSGKFKVKAEFEAIEKDQVVLKKADGAQIRVSINRLSKADREYLRNRTTDPSPDSETQAKVPVTQVLKSPVSFSLAKQSVAQGLKQISEELSINICMYIREAPSRGSAGMNREIEYTPSGQSFENALDSMLTPLQLTWSDFDGVLLITSAASSPMNFRVYRVKSPEIKSEYVDGMMDKVAPNSWIQNGGQGIIYLFPPNRLVVYNEEAVHRELEKMYSGKLVLANSTRKKASPPSGLDRPITFHFQQVPLKTCLASVSKMTDLKISLDVDALREIGISEDEPVTLDLEKVRARTALTLILQPCGLCTAETDGTISITSKEKAEKNLITAEHNLSGILGNNLSPILQAIENVIAPRSWQSRGGKASFTVKGPGLISVTQTSENHSAIKKLISDLRDSSR